MAERYTNSPRALERMIEGNCPECGEAPDRHDGWGGPRGCTLTDNGVARRIHDLETERAEHPGEVEEIIEAWRAELRDKASAAERERDYREGELRGAWPYVVIEDEAEEFFAQIKAQER